ncbi:MAG TPA: hypothetical protein DEP84_05980 [Chloroflexi bacterium]|nr:hypothetical protein [Chloroflexota bacterium]
MERKLISGRRRVLFALALLVLVLPALTLTASAGRPVGTPFPISAGTSSEASPAAVYSSQSQEYMVAWYNDLPGNDDIHVERVSRDGKLLKHTCVACGPGAERRYPDIAYNSKNNEYLVVWVEEDPSTGLTYVKGQRLAVDGTPKGSPINVFAAGAGYEIPAHPAVAYAYTSNKYLVVWQLPVIQPGGAVEGILGRIVNADGSMPDPYFYISVGSVGAPGQQPDVAYNRHANGFLVVWQQLIGGTTWSIYGQLLTGDGGIPPGFVPIQIAYYGVNCTAPAVAAIPTTPVAYKYLVVWEYEYAPNDRDIYGKVVEENGTPYLSSTPISTTGDDESEPAVAGDEAGERYLVAWSQRKGTVDVPIHVQAVNRVGNLVYDKGEFGGPTAHYPAVAAGSAGTFLVAWQDKGVFATDTDILGQFWGNRVYVPLIFRNHH